MATLTMQPVPDTGVAPAYAAANAGGDKCVAGNGVFLHVKNGGASPITVTLATPGTVQGLAIADRAVSVPNAGERMIAVPDLYRDPADGGLASISYSGVTSVTVAAFRV